MLTNIILILAAIFIAKVAILALVFKDEIDAAMERDPAAGNRMVVILTYAGFHAMIYHRIAHQLHGWGLRLVPRMISQGSRFLTGIEIHPAARIGKGLFIDHGSGVVIGETAIIGNAVTIYQGVTLGGTGKEKGKRHPTIGNNVVIGTGAKVLGNIRVGDNSFVGANAVVVKEVPPNSTVVGVPGRIARREGRRLQSADLDQTHLPDPVSKALQTMQNEIRRLEQEVRQNRENREPREPKEKN